MSSLLMNLFGRRTQSLGIADDRYYEQLPLRTYSGVRVDESTAFNYSVCWAATRLLGGTSGWLPFNLYKRHPDGGANVDSEHPVHRLIHDQPNPDMGSMMFRARGVNHQVNWGNTYSEIIRTAGGVPVSLEPIHPRRIPAQNIKREGGKLVYYVNRPDGAGPPQKITQEFMFHVPSIISDDGIIGKGVITNARESIGKAIGTQRRGSSAINHGGAPPLALKGAKFKDKKDQEDFRRQWDEVHAGAENAGKLALLPKDSEVQMLGYSLEDSQFIESEQFDIEEMARWYGVPPHLVGHLLRATFNNIEELGISFVKYSLIQWLKLWEQEVWRKLLTPAEQKTHYAKFVVDALERGNLASRTEAGVKKFFNGLWTLNDWASQEDMNPIQETTVVDGETVSLGDMHFVQQAMIPLAQAAKGPPPAAGATAADAEPPTDTQKPPPDDNNLRVEVASAIASTATLALAVERIVSAVGVLQSEGSRLAATVAKDHAESLEAIATMGADISGKVQEIATAQSELATNQQGVSLTINELGSKISELTARAAGSEAMHKAAAAGQLRDALGRLISVEVHNVKNMAQTASKFDQRLTAFYGKHRDTMETALLSPVSVFLMATGDSREPTEAARERIEAHITTSTQQLLVAAECQPEELSAKVDECVSKWHEERATVTI